MTDPFHSALENMAKYDDIDCLKSLYRNYHNLRKLGQMGNQSAISIYLDLERGLNELSYKNRIYVFEYLINKTELNIIAKDLDVSEKTIFSQIEYSLKKISQKLGE